MYYSSQCSGYKSEKGRPLLYESLFSEMESQSKSIEKHDSFSTVASRPLTLLSICVIVFALFIRYLFSYENKQQ